MTVRWRIFRSDSENLALGIKVKRGGKLWIPEIVAISHRDDHMRLDRVTHTSHDRLRVSDGKAVVTVDYRSCTVPLTLDEKDAFIGTVTLHECPKLRAVPNYGKRGTWYKITPR